jgi:hypothetical protein
MDALKASSRLITNHVIKLQFLLIQQEFLSGTALGYLAP